MQATYFISYAVANLSIRMVLATETLIKVPTKFPDLFQMEDYYKCSENPLNSYCSVQLKLVPRNASSKIWQVVEGWSASRLHYNRTIIYRKLCIPNSIIDRKATKQYVENRNNGQIEIYNLTSEIYDITCKDEYALKTNIFWVISAIYLSLIIAATLYDNALKGGRNKTTLEKWLLSFSVKSNLKNAIKNQSADFERLKCVHGIRTFQSTIIIMGHVLMNLMIKHLKNTEDIEHVFSMLVVQYSFTAFMLLMQTYFLLSTWLLTNQILTVHKENGRFSLRDAILLIGHRIARFWPPLLVMIFFESPLFLYFKNGPGCFEVAHLINDGCSKNWWTILIFATNFINTSKSCNPGLWYLAIDMQLYLCAVIFLYLTLKYKKSMKKYLALAFILTYLINSLQIYQKGLFLDTWVNLKNLQYLNLFYNEKIWHIYGGFWINTSSSIIGILFGYLYFCNKQNNNKKEPYERFYGAIFLLFCLLAPVIALIYHNLLATILIGPLLKPLYGLGIATGIYGMSRNVIRGYCKSICENKYAVLLGNFTFCVYVFQFHYVFTRGSYSTYVLDLKLYDIALAALEDIIASWILGIITTIIIEQPGVSIKNIILPPVRNKQAQCKKEENKTS